MRDYVVKRILGMLPVVFGAALVVFTIMHVVPGDVAALMASESGHVQDAELIRVRLGLDRPLYEQFFIWLGDLARLNLGESVWSGKPVAGEILQRIGVSAELLLLAFLVSLSIAIPVGVLSAIRQDTASDYIGRIVAITFVATPGFWIGTLIIVAGSIWFGWIPPMGYVSIFDDPLVNLQQFIFPALALGASMCGSVMRMTRSTLLEVLRQDYIRTAWSKGLRETLIIRRHALKNAMIPVITILGLQVGRAFGEAVVMEQVFSLPGLGRLILGSIFQRDYPLIQGAVLFVAVVFVVTNLLVDLAYAWLDPRIRYG